MRPGPQSAAGIAARLRAIPVPLGNGPPAGLGPDVATRNRDLVRLATLAANSHNTQPWLFDIGAAGGDTSPHDSETITIRPDLRRRCPVVDPDDHHLFVSLGCAAENLVIGATAYGLRATPVFHDGPDPRIIVTLEAARIAPSPLLDAIVTRQSTRSVHDGHLPLGAARRAALAATATSGVGLHLIEASETRSRLRDIVIAANAAQMRGPAFRQELRHWIRFGEARACATRDGLFSRCAGQPALPDWLGNLLFPLIFRVGPETARLRTRIDSAAALAVFVSAGEQRSDWVETGRCFQRFALEATRLGLVHAHLNQPVEVPTRRAEVARLLHLRGGRVSLILRLGRARPMPYALRRPVEDVILREADPAQTGQAEGREPRDTPGRAGPPPLP